MAHIIERFDLYIILNVYKLNFQINNFNNYIQFGQSLWVRKGIWK